MKHFSRRILQKGFAQKLSKKKYESMKITTQVAENLDPEEFIETRSLCSHSNLSSNSNTAQIIKFSMKDFFSKCDQIRRKLRIWSHLLKKSLMENFIFCAVQVLQKNLNQQLS